jgi:hypothetical protein
MSPFAGFRQIMLFTKQQPCHCFIHINSEYYYNNSYALPYMTLLDCQIRQRWLLLSHTATCLGVLHDQEKRVSGSQLLIVVAIDRRQKISWWRRRMFSEEYS